MKEVQFIRACWLELAAANFPNKVLVFSYSVDVPDFPEANRERVSVPFHRPNAAAETIRRKSA